MWWHWKKKSPELSFAVAEGEEIWRKCELDKYGSHFSDSHKAESRKVPVRLRDIEREILLYRSSGEKHQRLEPDKYEVRRGRNCNADETC